MAITDQRCDVSGLYLSTGSCCHAAQISVVAGDRFGGCPKCGRSSQWTLLREMYRLERAMPLSREPIGADYGAPAFAPDQTY